MRPRLVTTALTAAAALAGSLGTRPASDWYESLDKPDWQPPKAAFPLVWTPLYGLIAWGPAARWRRRWSSPRGTAAGARADDRGPRGERRVVLVFFARRSPSAGLAVIVGLDALNLALLREAARHDRAAAAALAPRTSRGPGSRRR